METKELIALAFLFLALGVVHVGWFGKGPKAMAISTWLNTKPIKTIFLGAGFAFLTLTCVVIFKPQV